MIENSLRLTFKKFSESDFDNYYSLCGSFEVMKFITGKALTLEETKARFNKMHEINNADSRLGFFLVRSLENNQFLGLAKLIVAGPGELELGYSLLPEFWGQNFASEIADHLIYYSHNFPEINSLIGIIDPANEISRKLLEKRGFKSYESKIENSRNAEYLRMELPGIDN
ncbi:MAG: GNAT family N-acetyltransferase [Daejeonella sp.]